jgi:O-succinylbenzoic acid--CoA ligase
MLGMRDSDLIASRWEPGPRWVDLLGEAWGAGAAILPVDHRLPQPEVDRLLDAARPTAVANDDGTLARRDDGEPVAPDVRLVMATSGTSAAPKLVELTQRALTAAVTSSAARIGATTDDPWICCLPVAHMGGMLVLLRAVVLGAPVRVHAGFDTDDISREAAAGARFTSLVPTALRRLLDAGVDLSGFGAILIGGARIDASLLDRAGVAGARVVRTYGMTETCGGCVYDGVPLDGTEVRIDPNDGQVLLRGPTLMRGYRRGAEAASEAFDPEGWLRTGDAGSIRGGTLTVHGRLDDLIVTGGENVWPSRVEDALRTHPGVGDVRVEGRPDATWGQRVVAIIVPADPGEPPPLEALRDHVASTLPRYAAPRDVIFVTELASTTSGKPARQIPSPG